MDAEIPTNKIYWSANVSLRSSIGMKDEFLFVYGTLRRDARCKMSHMLARCSDFIGEATYQAKLYRVTYYPCVVPSKDPAYRVQGEVYRLRNPALLLPLLDEYEECGLGFREPTEYVRLSQEIQLRTGQTLSIWVYIYNRPVRGFEPIPSGSFSAAKTRQYSETPNLGLTTSC